MKTRLLRAFSKCGRAHQTATHQTSNEGVFHSSAFVSIRVHSWFLTASLRLSRNNSVQPRNREWTRINANEARATCHSSKAVVKHQIVSAGRRSQAGPQPVRFASIRVHSRFPTEWDRTEPEAPWAKSIKGVIMFGHAAENGLYGFDMAIGQGNGAPLVVAIADEAV